MIADQNVNAIAEGTAPTGYVENKKALLATLGGIIGAIAASSCCILPLALFGLGIGGAWVGNLTALTPYALFFKITTIGFVGSGHYLFYRQRKTECAEGEACSKPLPNRLVKTTLWVATLIIFAALLFPYVAPTLLDV
jgi:mercuric ion transport protein